MNKTLQLTIIDAFKVSYYNDGGPYGKTVVIGYYLEESNAKAAAIGSGYWGKNADVEPMKVATDGERIYNLIDLGVIEEQKADLEAHKQTILKNIKSKLTPQEWEFWHEHMKEQTASIINPKK